MGNEAAPLVRANYGIGTGPQVTARYGLIHLFKLVIAPLARTFFIRREDRDFMVRRK